MSESSKDRFSKHLVKPPVSKKAHYVPQINVISGISEQYKQSKTLNGMHEEYILNKKKMTALKRRQFELKTELDKHGFWTQKGKEYFDKPFQIYVLKLEDDCWYIGSSRNVNKRFKKHMNGTGSKWTKMHRAISIEQIRPTEALTESEACLLEDQVTIEFALKYCAQKVRGGGFCQVKATPRWPKEVKEAEAICSHT